MKMNKIKIGDRVKCNGGYLATLTDKEGTVINISGTSCGVRFDEKQPGLHTLDGNCEDCHGWYLDDEYLEIISRLDKAERKKKIKEIIKEINKNDDFKKQIQGDVGKEVDSWSDQQINNW